MLYQLVHAVVLLVVGLLLQTWPDRHRLLNVAGWLFVAGGILFSGSIFLLVLGAPAVIGPITPLGGLAFIAGWLLLVVSAWRRYD